ncbi:MAG: DUF1080 domain-containing protein [Pseudomonadales bacterium]|nr:DUF1080 domain-containing protein [Pseudomonadales bacterium]
MKNLDKVFCILLLFFSANSHVLGETPSTLDQTATFERIFTGQNLRGWNTLGDANWQVIDGVVQANSGQGMLVTQRSYQDFHLKLEFWVDESANSGIFIRVSDPSDITATNAYEINIYDSRPDQTYRTGGIVNLAPPLYKVLTGNRWNSYEIIARGAEMEVILNGKRIVTAEDKVFKNGPIGFQFGKGIVKFRNIVIKTLD